MKSIQFLKPDLKRIIVFLIILMCYVPMNEPVVDPLA